MNEEFAITCIDCGGLITDGTPWGEAETGPVHLACADDETRDHIGYLRHILRTIAEREAKR
jgi:hypothetical protein